MVVIEKGRLFKASDVTGRERSSLMAMYDNGGVIATVSQCCTLRTHLYVANILNALASLFWQHGCDILAGSLTTDPLHPKDDGALLAMGRNGINKLANTTNVERSWRLL